MHPPCRVTVTEDCGLVARGGKIFCSPLCLPAGVQTLVLGPSCGNGGGGVAGPRWLNCFGVGGVMGSAGGGVFLGGLARHARPRRHLPCQCSGGGVIDPEVVSDGEVTEGGSDRSARGGGGGGKGKKQAARDSKPPPKKSWRAREMHPYHKRRLWRAPFVSLDHRAPCP